MRRWFLVTGLGLAFAVPAVAGETVAICHNYGCAAEESASYSEAQLAWVRELLSRAQDPGNERELLALAVGRLYRWAGEQTPIWRDKGGNFDDDEVNGRMDCIDHSTTTTRLLRMLEDRGWLHFHRVLDPVRRVRFLFAQHFSAAIEESAAGGAGDAEPAARFAVDSWYVDNGHPPPIIPLEAWLDGEGPGD